MYSPLSQKKKLYNCVLTANGYFSSQIFLRCYPHLAQIKFLSILIIDYLLIIFIDTSVIFLV